MKVKPVNIIDKHLRPISPTPALSINKYIGPAILEVIDPNQYGAIQKTSTLHALISSNEWNGFSCSCWTTERGVTRMDTPKYGETLEFMYISYQPILVVLPKV